MQQSKKKKQKAKSKDAQSLMKLCTLHTLLVLPLLVGANPQWPPILTSNTITKPSSTNPSLAFATTNPSKPKPINREDWPERFPAKEHCSKCGLCETTFVQDVSTSCAFLNEGMARIDSMEERIHGRRRRYDRSHLSRYSEDRFGVLYEPIRLAKGIANEHDEDTAERGEDVPQPQWTGLVTSIAISMLEEKKVDAVVCIASDDSTSFAEPLPIIAKTTKEVLKGRGVKPSLAPSLSVLDEIQNDPTIRKLLFCGVGCAVQAFRAVEMKLGLEEVYVLGVNCADNSPTPKASQNFLKQSFDLESVEDVYGYEFMQDFRVHLKMKSNNESSNASSGDDDDSLVYQRKPYFCLPSSVAKESIAPSCLACFDYTNALSDVVVGYMGAPFNKNDNMHTSFQTLTCRNEKGQSMINTALEANRIMVLDEKETVKSSSPGWLLSFENLAVTTVSADAIVQELIQKDDYVAPDKTMPYFVGDKIASILDTIGPRGLDFATYSIDYHILRNYLYVLDTFGKENIQLPQYVKDIVQHYLDTQVEFRKLHDSLIKSKELR